MAAHGAAAALTTQRRHHALAIPFPCQGHVNPLMRFCRRLAAQEGFTITFLDIKRAAGHNDNKIDDVEVSNKLNMIMRQELNNTDYNIDDDDEEEGLHERRQLDIRKAYLAMPHLSGGPGVIERLFAALHSLAPQIEQLLLQLLHQNPPLTCLISDFLVTDPTQCLADKYHLPRIALYPSCQTMLLLFNYILEGVVPLEKVFKVVESREALVHTIFQKGLPGLPPLKVEDLLYCPTDKLYVYTHGVQALQETKSNAHAIVVNSLEELEGDALKVPIGIPIYAVGPLVEPLEKETNTSFWEEDETCISWLDSQPPSSVLFVSFGSIATLTRPQFEELVFGLLSSQQRFLWVIRPDLVEDASCSTFLRDLLARSHDGKGYVAHWVPQVRVLSHPSIHGFLTHCGWNSTVEAISQGIPMLCFPYAGDQFMDAKLIIEEWKVGLGFEENKESTLIGREEVEKAVLTLLRTEEGKQLHTNAQYLKRACDQTYSSQAGSAFKNIQDLVQSLDKIASE